MLVLLPFICIGALLDAIVCISCGYSGAILVLMLVVLFAAFFAGLLILFVCILSILSLFIDPKKPQKTHSGFHCAAAKYALGVLSVLAGVRIHLSGEDKIPEGRWLLVCNHRSGFDPVLTIWALRKYDLAFVAKPSIMEIPVIGKFAHKICCMAIDREDDRAALRTILGAADLIKNDVTSFGIYPEGKRNTGEGLLPFRNGAFKIAQKAKVPIVVMTVENTEKITKNVPFRHTDVHMRILEVISAEQVQALKTSEIGEEVRRCMERGSA